MTTHQKRKNRSIATTSELFAFLGISAATIGLGQPQQVEQNVTPQDQKSAAKANHHAFENKQPKHKQQESSASHGYKAKYR